MKFKFDVGYLRNLIADLPDDAKIVMRGPDHTYECVGRLSVKDAYEYNDGYLMEPSPHNSPESIVPVVVVSW